MDQPHRMDMAPILPKPGNRNLGVRPVETKAVVGRVASRGNENARGVGGEIVATELLDRVEQVDGDLDQFVPDRVERLEDPEHVDDVDEASVRREKLQGLVAAGRRRTHVLNPCRFRQLGDVDEVRCDRLRAFGLERRVKITDLHVPKPVGRTGGRFDRDARCLAALREGVLETSTVQGCEVRGVMDLQPDGEPVDPLVREDRMVGRQRLDSDCLLQSLDELQHSRNMHLRQGSHRLKQRSTLRRGLLKDIGDVLKAPVHC